MARREFANLPTTPRETGTVVVLTPGGALADISLTVDGDAIEGSVLTVAADGIIPTFYGPPAGTDGLVVTMKSHGVDWDATVLASDAAPSSGGSSRSTRLSVQLPPSDFVGASATAATAPDVKVDEGDTEVLTADAFEDDTWKVDASGTDVEITWKSPGLYAMRWYLNANVAADSVVEVYTSESGWIGSQMPYLQSLPGHGLGQDHYEASTVVEVREDEAPLTFQVSADGWYAGAGSDPETYAPNASLKITCQRIG